MSCRSTRTPIRTYKARLHQLLSVDNLQPQPSLQFSPAPSHHIIMPGLLLVFSQPGPDLTDEEFNEYYENEQIPQFRAIPGFTSWSRWVAVDGKRPGFVAFYDLTSPDVLAQPPYSELAAKRTERDTSIVSRLALVDRRTYTLREPVYPPKAGAAYDALAPGPFVSIVEIEAKAEFQDQFDQWYDEEHIPMIAKVPGWLRSCRFVLEDAPAQIGAEATATRPPRNLAIHEWETPAAFETPEFKEATSTPWLEKLKTAALVEARRRVFKFAKSWDRA